VQGGAAFFAAFLQYGIVDGTFKACRVDPQGGGGVGLGIEIDNQRLAAVFCEKPRNVHA